MRNLSVAVIEDAINRIKTGENHFSCVALHHASGSEFDSLDENPYVMAYKGLIRKMGCLYPVWWNSWGDYTQARVEALEDFKEAVEKAQTSKPLLARLKDWLTSPCTVGDYK